MNPPAPSSERAKARARASRVALLHSPAYLQALTRIELHGGRDTMLLDLLESTGLASWVTLRAPAVASKAHLQRFHSEAYVNALEACDPALFDETPADPSSISKSTDSSNSNSKDNNNHDDSSVIRSAGVRPLKRQREAGLRSAAEREEFGLVDDCAPFPGVFQYACAVAGASLQAADGLARGEFDVAINWGGGRHHGMSEKAEGFCFVNDCVLACLHLGRRFKRILYFDLDVHHGDGVQFAFYQDPSVFTVSFHHKASDFYPAGSGRPQEVGEGSGLYHNLNIPLKAGCSDEAFTSLFEEIFDACVAAYRPQAVVFVVGADTLGEDPLGRLNLTANAIQAAVRHATLRCYDPASFSAPDRTKKTLAAKSTSENSDGDSSTSSSSSSSSSSGDYHTVRSSSIDCNSTNVIDSTAITSSAHKDDSISFDPSASNSSRGNEEALNSSVGSNNRRKLPLLLLGGGGYAAAATARAWACATAAACGPFVEEHVLPKQVPASAQGFECHGPDFLMHSSAAVCGRPDENTPDYLRQVSAHAKRVLKRMKEHARCERNASKHQAQPCRQPSSEQPTPAQDQRQPERLTNMENELAVNAPNILRDFDSNVSKGEPSVGATSGLPGPTLSPPEASQFEP